MTLVTKKGYGKAYEVEDHIELLMKSHEVNDPTLIDDFTRERTESNDPLDLTGGIEQVYKHTRAAARYVAFAPEVKRTTNLYNTVQVELTKKYGYDTAVALKDSIEYAMYGDKTPKDWLSKTLAVLRGRTVATTLSLNPPVWVNQSLTLPHIAALVGPDVFAKATLYVASHPIEAVKESLEAPWMEARSIENNVADLHDQIQYSSKYLPGKSRRGVDIVAEASLLPIEYFDKQNAAVAYFAGKFQHLKNNPGDNAGTDRASRRIVERTQTMTQDAYRAPIHRGGEINKMLGVFMSQTIRIANDVGRDYSQMKTGEQSKLDFTRNIALKVAVPAVLATVVRAAFSDRERTKKQVVGNIVQNIASVTSPVVGSLVGMGQYGGKMLALRIPQDIGEGIVKAASLDMIGAADKEIGAALAIVNLDWRDTKKYTKTIVGFLTSPGNNEQQYKGW